MSTESENIDRVVKALKTVPAKSLLLIDLANSIPIKNGLLDARELTNREPEINLAIAEVQAYGSHTIRAVEALVRVKAMPG